MSDNFVENIPLGMLGLITIAFILGSIELGWRLGRYRKKQASAEDDAPISAPVGAILGLLAFLLAFTFGMAAARFDTRKQLVMQEANSIGTTYLRVDFLPAEIGAEMRGLLRDYLALRSQGVTALMTPVDIARSGELQDRMWALAAAATDAADTISNGLFIESLNETIDLDTERITAGRNHIPETIWLMLGMVVVVSMVAMGYQFGLTAVRSWPVTILMTVALTAVILLIADLDRPQAGWLQVSQQPLLDLLDKIAPPAP